MSHDDTSDHNPDLRSDAWADQRPDVAEYYRTGQLPGKTSESEAAKPQKRWPTGRAAIPYSLRLEARAQASKQPATPREVTAPDDVIQSDLDHIGELHELLHHETELGHPAVAHEVEQLTLPIK